MAKIIHFGTQIQSNLAVEDGDGNAFPLQIEPIPILRPTREAFDAAWERWEARLRQMEAIPDEKVAELVANAERQARGEEPVPPPANRGARRQAAKQAVREALKEAPVPVNGKRHDAAAKPIEARAGAEE